MKMSCLVPAIKIQKTLLAVLPRHVSAQLPSRGQVMVGGKINNLSFTQALEPDGRGSHWIRLNNYVEELGVRVGDTVHIELESLTDWPEPTVPADIKRVITQPELKSLWQDVTTMSRWEWIRWIEGTANPETRKKRIDIMVDKLQKGIRRPCCFNRTACTDMSVSKGGVLLV